MSSRSAISDCPSPEWLTLLRLCSLPPAPAPDTFNAAKLLALAGAHGVTGQLAANLARYRVAPGEPLEDGLRSAKRAQLLANMPLVAELFRVLEVLAAARIETAVVKGPVLSVRAFGDPSVRQYGDIDFLLRSADIPRASEALVCAGYNPSIPVHAIRAQKTPGQYMFRRSAASPLIELHTERTLRYFPRPLPIGDFFERATTVSFDGRRVPALAVEDEFVLIAIHGAKHFWERLMWIADVAAMVDSRPEIDWRRLRRSAASLGALRMVRVALLLAERLLAVPVPEPMKEDVAGDPACQKIVGKITSWLPYAGNQPPPLVERALFRFRMRGQLLAGARYLTRLSLSTTEEDWSDDRQAPTKSLRESLQRPFRLARKYRRNPGPPPP